MYRARLVAWVGWWLPHLCGGREMQLRSRPRSYPQPRPQVGQPLLRGRMDPAPPLVENGGLRALASEILARISFEEHAKLECTGLSSLDGDKSSSSLEDISRNRLFQAAQHSDIARVAPSIRCSALYIHVHIQIDAVFEGVRRRAESIQSTLWLSDKNRISAFFKGREFPRVQFLDV